MYNEIINFLDQRRLKEGLVQLRAFAEKADNWNILSSVDTLQTNYEYMLKYASEGQKDPGRKELLVKLFKKAYELADEIEFDQKMSKGYGGISDKYRCYKIKPAKSFSELQEELEKQTQTEGHAQSTSNGEYREHEKYSPHCQFIDELFDKTITSTHWSSSEYREAYKLLDKGMSIFDIEVWISAITLSLLSYFDLYKFNFLLNVYLDKQYPEIKTRALVGIALTNYYYEDRIKFYANDAILNDFVLDQEEINSEFHLIQQIFLLSRETEKIDKKMREEILPQMLKNPYLKHQDKKFEEIELSELEEDNPEWEKDIDKITEHIHELGELQREGADTYMSTFAMLKHYKFFNEIAHWFYPFSKETPEIAKIFTEKEIKEKSILSTMLNSPAFCNSDKYSFALALDEIPLQQISMMGEDVHGREEFLNDQLGAPLNLSEKEKRKISYRQYIHDIYRFFKLWSYRKQLHDIFTDSLALWNSSSLRPHIVTGNDGKDIANHLLAKGYYKEAANIYNFLLVEYPIDLEILQKAGFAYQKLKDFKEALKFYNQGYILKPQDTWTLKHMAHCYKKIHDEEKALKFFQLAENLDMENLNITLQIGQCLASLNRYDEALKCFFKVEYLGKTPENARRAIAWCYFMTGKYKEASRFYEKIIHESTPDLNDWLNYGHVYMVQEDIPHAISCYKEAATKCETHDEFVNVFSKDLDILKQAGVDDTMLLIIQDLV